MKSAVFAKNHESSAPKPAFAIAAPAIPPRRACDDDVGSPHHHVSRSQRTAPTSPSVTTLGEIPFAMLPATCVLKSRNAMKLNAAAQRTALFGERTRVE